MPVNEMLKFLLERCHLVKKERDIYEKYHFNKLKEKYFI